MRIGRGQIDARIGRAGLQGCQLGGEETRRFPCCGNGDDGFCPCHTGQSMRKPVRPAIEFGICDDLTG